MLNPAHFNRVHRSTIIKVERVKKIRPAVKSTRTFAKALKRLKLRPTILVSAHSPMKGTMKDLQKALDTKVA
ncbi:MAG: LytTR family transcriptional regulator DNA-binding domain-containing protein [Pseudomonadales bacterium]